MSTVELRSIPPALGMPIPDGAFAPVERECDEVLRDVSGALPAGLTGTLYRCGPARWAMEHAVHAFDGDGMMSQLVLDGSSVRYRNRFVETPNHLAGGQRGIGTERQGGWRANMLRVPTERANTTAVVHADRLLALADYGRPWELEPDTLQTLGPCDFDGSLSRVSMFSPHPKVDPRTGELFNFGLAPTARVPRGPRLPVSLRCYRIRPDGQMSTLATVPLDHVYINHDFAITERYLVFVLAPLVVSEPHALLALFGLRTYESATGFRPEIGTRIVLVPRDGGRSRVIECPAIPYVHLNNAFEDRGDVVADLIRYDDYAVFNGAVRDVNTMTELLGGRLARVRITSSDRVEIEDLCSELGEFPQHDWRRTGRSYRYSYYSAMADGDPAIVKVDNDAGTQRAHSFGLGRLPGEPIFVPQHLDSREDDGWLLTLVARERGRPTELHIIDAGEIEREAVAVAVLPHHAFPGFHGTFTPRIAR